MRIIAATVALAGAALAGCTGYGGTYGSYENPYNSTEDQETFEAAKAYALEIEVEAIRREPPAAEPSNVSFADIEIDAWKAATIDVATSATLERMRMASTARVEFLRARIAELKAGAARVNEVDLRAAKRELALEERRLSVITSAR